ncbi:MAG: precorrin-2 C(20)-methyltransferase [Thermaerobacter sp.]|nr:precorrin-2 C(20)-methyltransferase [Thermaerobacter sp.]
MATRLWGVGLGPGDPELLTIRARRVLGEAERIFCPAAWPGKSRAGALVASLGLAAPVEELVFPMSRGAEAAAAAAAARAVAAAPEEEVAFACLGDPGLYSTFGYLRRELSRSHPELAVEVVPGVTSLAEACARAGQALVLGGQRLAVLPGDVEPAFLDRALADFDAVAFMKQGAALPRALAAVRRAGRLEEAALFGDLAGETRVLRAPEAAPAGYFSLLMVRRGGWPE